MKSLKPTRIDESETHVEEESVKTLTPQRVDEEAVLKEVEEEEKKRLTSLKAIGGFAQKGLVVGGLLASLIVIGTIYDAAFTASSMLSNMPILGVVYLALLVSLIGILGYGIFKQFLSYSKLKRIDSLQQEGLNIIKNKKGDVKAYALKIITQYEKHPDKEISQKAVKLKD